MGNVIPAREGEILDRGIGTIKDKIGDKDKNLDWNSQGRKGDRIDI